MSLLTSELYSTLDHFACAPEQRAATPPGAQISSYTLTHSVAGWTLLIRRHTGTHPGWATPLAPHGAGPHAPTRVAQAVGVRVLQEFGVEVTGWSPVPEELGEMGKEVVARSRSAVERDAPRGVRGH